MNSLFFGENLTVLRLDVKDEGIAFVYLDPPCKSNQGHDVLFAEQGGPRSAAKVRVFEDTCQRKKSKAWTFHSTPKRHIPREHQRLETAKSQEGGESHAHERGFAPLFGA